MQSAEISRRWLRFFEERGHTVVPSASLIADDPTLLLVNAGMVPFKPYFLGVTPPPFPRATSVQKVVRTVDIDEVGKTTRHASFFQMCGNFSFGDYFKETAIPLAWELVTRPVAEGGFGLEESKLWVTVYLDDDEAADIWQRVVGVPAERIQRLGMEDNFWSMGVPGPCGPCSEINYDRGPDYGEAGGPAVNGERYLEIWNLVFMQYLRGEGPAKKDYPILGDLPKKNIDTGLGLERLAALLQGVDNIYETDGFRPILDQAAELAGHRYGADHPSDVALRVVADHVRTGVMLIGDGITPGNEGRGYVLRRILRRAIRNMRLLGAHQETIGELVRSAIGVLGPQYPELVSDQRRIEAVATTEEASFLHTLRAGTAIFDVAADEAKQAGRTTFGGEQAFVLHDTYGFPIDLTLEMASEQGLTVDEDEFRRLMQEQRQRAKADAASRKTGHADVSAYRSLLDRSGPNEFTGYEQVSGEGRVRGLLLGGEPVEAAGKGDEVDLVLDRTPFYAESGGQLADEGLIRLDGGGLLRVRDVQTPIPGLIVHRGSVVDGELRVGAEALAEVDVARREAISRAHTATHMTHKAFREALGETASQAGSENSPGRFRFDFAAPEAVPPSVMSEVEQRVNDMLQRDLEVRAEIMGLDEARRRGAMALFGEKYGNEVRVVSIGDWATELCGGTHVHHSGQLGVVKLLHESSIGAGVRRVEALVGPDAYRYLASTQALVSQLTDTLKVRPEELPERVAAIVARLREAEKEIERLRLEELLHAAPSIAAQAADVAGAAVVTYQTATGTGADDLRRLALNVRDRLPKDRPGVVAVSALANGRPNMIVAVNDRGQQAGLRANELIRPAAKALGGGGGGKADVAQGGGANAEALDDAAREVTQQVAQVLGAAG